MDWKRYYENEHIVYPLGKELNKREEDLWRMVSKLIPQESIKSVLDVGCGAGHLTSKFSDYGITHVKGIDVSPYRIHFARGKYRRCNFEIGSITDLQENDNSFDLIAAIEVLEHIDDLKKAIKELKRVTKKWLLITVPFEQEIPIVLCPYCLNHFNYDGHLHSFKMSDIADLLFEHGLTIRKVEYHSTWKPAWKHLLIKIGLPQYFVYLIQKLLISIKLAEMPKPLWIGVLAIKT